MIKMFNCHMHVFTIKDVPEKFLPLQLVRWVARRNFPVLNWVVRHLNPFTDNDTFDRYLDFVKTAKLGTQKEVYEQCRKYYPDGTRFVALSMDLKYMGAGRVPRRFEDQLDELAELGPEVYKFIHADPRRGDVEQLVYHHIKMRKFKGVKLYPSIGYFPYDENLMPIYKICAELGVPVISHASPMGPVYYKGDRDDLLFYGKWDRNDPAVKGKSNQEICMNFTNPENFAFPMLKFPNVNFCLAHFGSDHWADYVKGDYSDNNWVKKIINLVARYDNCWTDISFTMHNEEYWPMLKILLQDNDKLRQRVLFGSDYYVNQTVSTEREWAIKFRAYLGEELFTQIAEFNPKKFFNE